MKRRDFCKSSILAAGAALSRAELAMGQNPAAGVANAPEVTRYVSEFIVKTRYEDIPSDVIALGKKSILDGFGLALAGSVSTLAPLMQQYLGTLGACAKDCAIIGTNLKAPSRFAAFANGNFIHADDYDDTQLAVGKDRVYGLLTHPTAPVLPGTLALAETRSMSGKDLMLAYNIGVEVECKIAEAPSIRRRPQLASASLLPRPAVCARISGP